MKQLELQLNKRLLIVEGSEIQLSKEGIIYKDENSHVSDLIEGICFNFICKGSDLTEDIAKEFFEYDWIFNSYQYYKDTVPILGDTGLNLFKVAIRNNGYYWDKPLKEWFYHKRYIGVERIEESFDYEKWQEAESRTFNPSKCIIFEII